MRKKSLSVLIAALFVGLTVFGPMAYAESEEVVISEEQIGAISQSCDSIKQSLKTLQKDDARVRAYIGSSYENLLSDFISPLNLRLVKNDKPSATLTDIHSNILTKRQDFSQSFILYSQDLENLISIDCKNSPEDFYKQLLKTRTSRAKLAKNVEDMRGLFTKYLDGTKKLKESL